MKKKRKKRNTARMRPLPKKARLPYALLEGCSLGLFRDKSLQVGYDCMTARPDIGVSYNVASTFLITVEREMCAPERLHEMPKYEQLGHALTILSVTRELFSDCFGSLTEEQVELLYRLARAKPTDEANKKELEAQVGDMHETLASAVAPIYASDAFHDRLEITTRKPQLIEEHLRANVGWCAYFAKAYELPFAIPKIRPNHKLNSMLIAWAKTGCENFVYFASENNVPLPEDNSEALDAILNEEEVYEKEREAALQT